LSVLGRTNTFGTWGLWVEGRLDRADYVRQTVVYNDATDLRLAGGPAWRPTPVLDVRLGAGMAYHRAETFQDTTWTDLFGTTQIVDSYAQPFLYSEASLLSGNGLWLLATVEVGRRDYDGDTDWDSDFWYVDLMASAEVPLTGGLALQALVNLTPERHRVPDDNTLTNYTSLDLVWRFR
jgi:hypothetical protein